MHRNRRFIGAVLGFMIVGLTGCAGNPTSASTAPAPATAPPVASNVHSKYGSAPLIDSTATYQGRLLHCIGVNHGAEDDSRGYNTAVSVSCDYMRFYAENPDLLDVSPKSK